MALVAKSRASPRASNDEQLSTTTAVAPFSSIPTTQPTTERLTYVMRDYLRNELQARLAGRQKRLGYFHKVQQLRQAGRSISQINRELAMNRSTVHRYAYAESFSERIQRPTEQSILIPYLTYLENRYQLGVVT